MRCMDVWCRNTKESIYSSCQRYINRLLIKWILILCIFVCHIKNMQHKIDRFLFQNVFFSPFRTVIILSFFFFFFMLLQEYLHKFYVIIRSLSFDSCRSIRLINTLQHTIRKSEMMLMISDHRDHQNQVDLIKKENWIAQNWNMRQLHCDHYYQPSDGPKITRCINDMTLLLCLPLCVCACVCIRLSIIDWIKLHILCSIFGTNEKNE